MKKQFTNFKKQHKLLRAFMYVSLCMCLFLVTTKTTAQVYYGSNQINLHLRSYFGNLSKPVGYPKYNHSMAGHTVDSLYYRAQHNDTIDNQSFFAMQQEMKAMAYDTINVINADTVFKYSNRFGTDTVQLGLMDYNYYRIKPVALNSNLYFNFDTVNDVLTDLAVRPGYPYDTYNCCVLSPMTGSINNAKVVYRIDPAFIFADAANGNLYTGSGILKIDFNDGTGWHTISPTAVSYYTANYAGGTGNAVIKWDVVDIKNPDKHKYGSAQMKVGTVTYTEPSSTFTLAGLDVGVYNGCTKTAEIPADKKVLIYLEGIDIADVVPSLSRGISEIYNDQILYSGVDDLRRFGYDIYVVSWQNSRIDIKQNAKNVENLLRWLRCNHPSQQPYVIMGESMGGLVARYALMDMERNPDKEGCQKEKGHNTRLLITMDTPHKGANVPMSVQFLYQEVVGLLSPFLGPANKAIMMAGGIGIDGIAAKQMLYYHANVTIPNATPQPALPHPLKALFMAELALLGNYPKYCKTIAMSNGSMAGNNQTNDYNGAPRVANDDLLNFNSDMYLNVLGLKIKILNANLQLKTNPNGTAPVYNINAGKFGVKIKLKWWGVKVTIGYGSIIQNNMRIITGGDGICVRPGGVYSVPLSSYGSSSSIVAGAMQGIIGKIFPNYSTLTNNGNGSYDLHNQWTQSGWFGNNAHIASQGLHWNFVPTISALDYGTTNLSYNVEADGFSIPSNTPFDAVMGIYTGCNEYRAEVNGYEYSQNRHHLTVRNDKLTRDGSVSSNMGKDITYKGAKCTNKQQVQFLNREIGDDELWLNNYRLRYNTRFLPELSMHVEQSPYLNYSGQIPMAQRKGIYTKDNPMSVSGTGFAQFNFNPFATPIAGVFTNVYLSSGQYSLTKYAWGVCCLSGQRLSNTQGDNTDANDSYNSLLVYPNPNNAGNSLSIDINTEEQGRIIITDILGKVLYTRSINSGSTSITTTKAELNISAGVYIVSLQLTSKTITQKLIID